MSATLKGQRGKGGGGIGPEEQLVVNALTRNGVGAGGGPDDNAAQGGHLVPVGDVWSITKASDPISARNLAQPITRRNGDPGTISAATGVRRLLPVECERLQGLPDGWTAPPGLHAPDSRRYAAVGDACTVPVVQWIAERLLRYGGAT